jgi:predicted nucleic acid-binding protein
MPSPLSNPIATPLPPTIFSEVACAALVQAMALSLSVYDASYLAQALKYGAALIMADQQ